MKYTSPLVLIFVCACGGSSGGPGGQGGMTTGTGGDVGTGTGGSGGGETTTIGGMGGTATTGSTSSAGGTGGMTTGSTSSAGGAGGTGTGGGPASCAGALDAALRQTSGDIYAGFATHFIDMTRFRNIGEATAPGLPQNEFPGRNGNIWVPFVANGRFVAFQFEADDVERLSQSIAFAETTVVLSSPFSVSISECPGDFRPQLTALGCMRFGGMGSMYYAVDATANYPSVCMIRPGKTYYFNIVYQDPNGADTCEDGGGTPVPYCGNLFTTYP